MSDKIAESIVNAIGQYNRMTQWYSSEESASAFRGYLNREGLSIVANEVLDEAVDKAKRHDEQEKKVENDVTKAIDAAVGEYNYARYDVKLERCLAFVNSLSASGFVVTNSRKLAETMIKAEEHDDLAKKIEDMERSIALLKIKAGAYDALVKLDIEDMARKAERYDELLKQTSEQEVCLAIKWQTWEDEKKTWEKKEKQWGKEKEVFLAKDRESKRVMASQRERYDGLVASMKSEMDLMGCSLDRMKDLVDE